MKLKIKFILLLLLFSFQGKTQINDFEVSVSPNPFDSLVRNTIQINEGDVLSFNFYNLQGQVKYSISSTAYFNTTQFSQNLDSIGAGVYFSQINVNGEDVTRKMVFKGVDSSFIMQFNIVVTPSKFEKETLKIFPNPSSSNEITVETETESTEVIFQVYTMNGKLVYEQKSIPNNKKAIEKILVSGWESGTYLVKMSSSLGLHESTFIRISEE